MNKSFNTKNINFKKEIKKFGSSRRNRPVVTRVNLINDIMTIISKENPEMSRGERCSVSMEVISEMDTEYK